MNEKMEEERKVEVDCPHCGKKVVIIVVPIVIRDNGWIPGLPVYPEPPTLIPCPITVPSTAPWCEPWKITCSNCKSE